MAFRKNLQGSSGAMPQAATISLLNDTATSVTAMGSSQTTAQLLANANSVVTTVAAGTGVLLQGVSDNGDEQLVANLGANALLVYPPVGAAISTGAANAGFTIPVGKMAFFKRITSLLWVVNVSA